jgi:Pyruvate/2-oxoacid:ferredoxin oxidoreductase gamma subunit
MISRDNMGNKCVNILIGSEVGQGLQTIGPISAKSLMRKGFSVHVTQAYESQVRGGYHTFAVRMGTEKVWSPQETVDIRRG